MFIKLNEEVPGTDLFRSAYFNFDKILSFRAAHDRVGDKIIGTVLNQDCNIEGYTVVKETPEEIMAIIEQNRKR